MPWARNTGTAGQIATATSLVPVDIEISHRQTVLSLPVLLPNRNCAACR